MPSPPPTPTETPSSASLWVQFMWERCSRCDDTRACHGHQHEQTIDDVPTDVGWADGHCRNHHRGQVPIDCVDGEFVTAEGLVRCECPGFVA